MTTRNRQHNRLGVLAATALTIAGAGALLGLSTAAAQIEGNAPIQINTVYVTQSEDGETIHAWGINSRTALGSDEAVTSFRYLGTMHASQGRITLVSEPQYRGDGLRIRPY